MWILVNDTLTPYLEPAGSYVKFVCDGLISQFVEVLVKGLASFDYSALFTLPKKKAVSFYACLFNSFSFRGWVAKELRTLHIEEYMDLVNDLRYAYSGVDGHCLAVDDMSTFLCGCPELCRKTKTTRVFRLSCLCLGHFPPETPSVGFGSAISSSSGPDLLENIERVQSYLLYCNPEQSSLTKSDASLCL